MKITALHILVNHEFEAVDLQKKLAEGAAFDFLGAFHIATTSLSTAALPSASVMFAPVFAA